MFLKQMVIECGGFFLVAYYIMLIYLVINSRVSQCLVRLYKHHFF